MSTNDDAFEKALPFMTPALKVAFQAGREVGFAEGRKVGRAEGLEVGQQLGYVAGVNAMTPAVADGLRHGSSECGKAMQGLKNMGLNIEPDHDDE